MPLIDTTQLALEAAMRGSMMRQSLLTNNLANADTPGYQAEDVNFQGALANAMGSGQSPSAVSFTPHVETQSTSADGNGVSPEQTSADLSENGLLYQQLAQIATTRDHIITSAIGPSS